MGIIYHTTSDNINKRKFKVLVPGDYEPVMHSYHREEGMLPISNPDGEASISYLAIKDIIDMCFKEVEFSLVNPKDLIIVTDLLSDYLDQMNPYTDRDPDLAIFLDRCRSAYYKLTHVTERRDKFIERTTGVSTGRKNIIDILGRML